MASLSPTRQAANVLRAIGCAPKVVSTLVAEVRSWQPWGALEEDDLWSIAVTTANELLVTRDAPTPNCIRTHVHWRIIRAFAAERHSHGWRRAHELGGRWEPPRPALEPPVWEWGRPVRVAA